MENSKNRGILLALCSMALSGAFMIPWKMAADFGSASSMVSILTLTAALANTALLLLQKGRSFFTRPSMTELVLGIFFAILTLGGNLASASSVAYLAPAMVSLFMRAEVIFVTLIAWFMLGEKANLKFWYGCIIVGLGLMIMRPPTELSEGWLPGVLFAILSAIMFALMAAFTRKYINVIDTMKVNSIRLWFSVIIWLPLHEGMSGLSDLEPMLIFYVALAALFGPVLGRVIFMNSSKYLEIRISALIVSGAPVFVLLLDVLFLGNWPTSSQLVGGAIMLAGIITIIYQPSKPVEIKMQ